MTIDKLDINKEIARYLIEKVKQKDLDSKLAIQFIKKIESMNQVKPAINNEPIAIIGMACRFPDADNPDQFWDNIASGKSSIKDFPPARMEDFRLNGGNVNSPMQKAGFLELVDYFDSEYFNIPPKTAKQMDPYHRLMLQNFIETIEDAGYHRGYLHGKSIGVYVGNDHTHRYLTSYLSFMTETNFDVLVGSWTAIVASRISYLLNLRGPSMVIDTACSSTLVAMDIAIKSILHGDCEAALVGGINLIFYPESGESDIQSKDFMVRTFDKGAKGTSWGEGVASIMLKPLSKAMKDRDNIHAVIKGIAVNNDGASNGLTAPNARAQQEVLVNAWKKAGISPENIAYIESHGTGTKLGDSIEITGITEAFRKFTKKRQFCSISSVKTNIGHTVGVAGMASLIKVVQSIKEKALPPSLNFYEPNPLIDFCNSPVYIQDRLTDWPSESPRLAGVNSFSLNGTNSHVVVEEAPLVKQKLDMDIWCLLTLSGRTPQLLIETATGYLEHLHRHSDLYYKNICFTASTGREHHPHRAAILCNGQQGLLTGLESLIDALKKPERQEDSDGVITIVDEGFILFFDGNIKISGLNSDLNLDKGLARGKIITEALSKDPNNGNLRLWQELSSLYVGGNEIDFSKLFINQDIKRCSLPPQIFRNQRYWQDPKPVRRIDNTLEKNIDPEPETAVALWNEAQVSEVFSSKDEEKDRLKIFIAWVWSEVLGYPSIDEGDDFHQLGGDSINGLRITQLINYVLRMEASPALILETSTFNLYVNRLREEYGLSNEKLELQVNSLETNENSSFSKEEEESFILSPAQKRMYLTANMMPDSVAYNVTQVMVLGEADNFDEVQGLIRKLIERHESLRTSFHMTEEMPMQIIHPKVDFNIGRRQLRDVEGKSREIVLKEELKKIIQPFDLSKAPLVRAAYLEFPDETYIVIDMHHIITDGTSMGIFFKDYKELALGRKLSPLSFKYRDAVSWVCNRLSEPPIEKQRQWWIKQFEDEIPLLHLPTDKNRPLLRDYRGCQVKHIIPMELYKKVQALAKESESTLYMVLLAILHNLMAKLGAGPDIVIGTPITGRPRFEFQNIMGMFVNTLPLRIQSNENDSFIGFLKGLKKYVSDAYAHQEYPYEALLEDLKIERDPGRNPLFDVYFALQNIDMGIPEDEDGIINFDSGSAKFDLTVTSRVTSKGLIMEWEYAEALYHHKTIERMAQRYETLLSNIVETPNKKLWELDIMDDREREFLLETWNQTSRDISKTVGITNIFEEWVKRQGNATALKLDDCQMTYEELNNRSNKIAHGIVNMGIEPGSSVALLLNRSFDMISAILGVLKAGCYYVPLDVGSPKERMVTMLQDGEAKLLLSHQNLAAIMSEEIGVLNLDYLDPHLPEDNLLIRNKGEDPAYVMYTSGSTGTPKGIQICHTAVIKTVCNAGYLDIKLEDVVLQLGNYSFDASTFDIFSGLLNGASLLLLHNSDLADPIKLGKKIRDNNASVFFITATLFNGLLDTVPECFDNTRVIYFGGEAASPHHVKTAYQRLGAGRLVNAYGPTETTVFACCYSVNKDVENDEVPIGRPTGNTNLYVLDKKMRLQPIGVPGELYIGGLGLAIKYVNAPELTAEKFVPNPFKPGERLYSSGDLVVLKDDGNIYYLGRLDHQIKLRGHRIELKEIESKAVNHSTIREAYVDLYIDENNGRNLALWVVPEDEDLFDERDLNNALAKSLPEYMIPPFITPLTQFPLNKNGKLDKSRLPSPVSNKNQQLREPRNKEESILLEIWKSVLATVDIGIDDNFFSLGGDSIKAIQVIAKLQAAGFRVQMDKLLQYQTIVTLAPHLEKRQHIESDQGEIRGNCPPTTIQHWFLNNTTVTNHFNQGMWIRTKENLNLDKLGEALKRVCQHHDALRLIVTEENNIRIRGYDEGNLYYLTSLSKASDINSVKAELIEIQSHIDLQNGPIVVAALSKASEESQLFIAIHHMAVDVVSWSGILEDLFESINNPENPLPPKTVPLPVWTQFLAEWANNGGAKDELYYWRDIAREIKDLQSPFPKEKTLQMDRVRVKHWIQGETGRTLCKEANKAFNTEPLHLILSVLTRTIGAWRKVSALLFNIEGHGREMFDKNIDITRTTGWFTSTYPVLLKGEGEVGEVVKSVKESLRTVPRKGFGYSVLRNLTWDLDSEDQEIIESFNPTINFNYLGIQESFVQGSTTVEALPSEITVDGNFETSWALDIIASQVNTAILLDITYPKSFFDEEEIEEFIRLLNITSEEVAKFYSNTIGEKTASDYTAKALQQDELNKILDDLGIE